MQMVSLILIRLIMIYVVDSAVFSFWEPSQAWLIILCKNIPRLNVTFWEGDPGCKVGLGTSQGQDWRIQKFHRLKRQPMFSEAFHTRWCQPFYFRIGIPVSPILNGKCFLFPLRKKNITFLLSFVEISSTPPFDFPLSPETFLSRRYYRRNSLFYLSCGSDPFMHDQMRPLFKG